MVWGGAKPPISSHGASPEARDPKGRQRGSVLGKGIQLQGLEGTLKLQDWTLTDEFAGLDIVGLDNPVFLLVCQCPVLQCQSNRSGGTL